MRSSFIGILTVLALVACSDKGDDSGAGDGGTADGGTADGGTADGGSGDGGAADGGASDGGSGDGGSGDGGSGDGGHGDGGSGGGDTGSACGYADLVWSAEVRDAKGVVDTVFTTHDKLTMVGVVSNPCEADVEFKTPDTCLVTSMEVVDSSGMGIGMGVACGGAVTLWTVPAGGTQEEAWEWGALDAEDYVLSVDFNVTRTSASTKFIVK